MLLKIGGELIRHNGIHQGPDIGISQLCLGLSLKLSVCELYGDDGGDALPAVLPLDPVISLDGPGFDAICIDGPGERRLEAGFMHTTLRRMHVIGKGQDKLGKAVIVLNGHLCRGVSLDSAHVDDVAV